MNRHTPGPWQCYADVPSTDPNWHIVTDVSRTRVLANVHIEPGNATDSANARLITAAPELLKALRDLIGLAASAMVQANRDGADYDIDAELKDASAALAKAEGSQ